jgi:hypothetical protein
VEAQPFSKLAAAHSVPRESSSAREGLILAMIANGNNKILTKKEFCQHLHEAVQALEDLTQSWYASSTSLLPRSDKEMLEVIVDACDNLSAFEDKIENGGHDDYFARAAKIGAGNVYRSHAVSGA